MPGQLVVLRGSNPREEDGEGNDFDDFILEVTFCHFCNILLGALVSVVQREEDCTGLQCQEAGITRGCLRGWLPRAVTGKGP